MLAAHLGEITGEGVGHMSVTVHGRGGSGIRVLPLPKE
jgi:hypothetical protein